MSLNLAQINLGTAPAGKDGDTQRTANSKTNDNMTAIAAAVDGLSTSVQANTTAIATKADKNVTDSLQAITSSLTGSVALFAQSAAPTGWLKANGALVSRTTYAALFAAIGTTFGAGDGATTFALPDLRGEFPRGWDDGRGVDAGRAFGSAQAGQLGAHNHGLRHDAGTAGSGYAISIVPNRNYGTGNYFTESTGGNETRPRNVALLACIKY